MAATTTSKRKRVEAKTQQLHAASRVVPIGELKPHPLNPNIGNLDEICASLERFGQYRPVVVNTRNGFIVAGHHTWLGARRLKWDAISVVEIDVDENEHLAIMVADNRISDMRQTDEALLDKILQQVKVLEGTGFTELDMEDLHTRVAQMLEEGVDTVTSLIDEQRRAEVDLRRKKTFDGSELGEEPDDEDEWDDDSISGTEDAPEKVGKRAKDDDPLLDAAEDMNGGLVQFKPPEDLTFPGSGELEIPKLSSDGNLFMTFDELPDNLLAWAGSATKDVDDPDQWWLYNWGIDSTSGMQQDKSQVIPAFYCYDEYFDNWWWYPERYAAKIVNSGIKYILTPDYSMETKQSRAFGIWQLYRNRWLARYFQEIGLKIVPNVSWKDGDELFLKKYVLSTLPKQMPLIAMQMQTIDEDEAEGGMETFLKHTQMVLDTLEPGGLLLYVGKQAQQYIDQLNIDCPVRIVQNRLQALGEQAKTRKRKKTI